MVRRRNCANTRLETAYAQLELAGRPTRPIGTAQQVEENPEDHQAG